MRGRPLGVRDMVPRKRMAIRASSDSECYLLSDSGCKEATEYLGEASCCLGCPFPECQLDHLKKVGRKANA